MITQAFKQIEFECTAFTLGGSNGKHSSGKGKKFAKTNATITLGEVSDGLFFDFFPFHI